MADRSAKLNLILAGDNRGAIKSVDQIGHEFGKVEGKAKGIGAGIAGAFSIGAVVAGGKKIVDAYEGAAGQVAKFKRLTGESAKDSSALVFAAQQAGIPFEKVAQSSTIFATNLEKGKVAAKGIVTKDGNGNLLDFNKILDNTADYLHSLPPGFQRTAAARDLFGKGGADMAKILGNGSQALDDQRAKMKALGLEFDENGLKKYGKLIAAQRDVSAGWKGMQVQIGSALAPALTTLFHGITEAEKAFERLPAPVKTGVVAITGLAVAVGGAVTALGFLGPAVARGLGVLGIGGKEAATAAVEVEGLGAATAQVALEQEAAAAASAAYNDTIIFGGTAEEAATAATVARSEALGVNAGAATVAAAAETKLATANLAVTASLGPVAVAAAAAYEAYKSLTSLSDHPASSELEKAVPRILAASNSELLKFADSIERTFGGEKGFEQVGRQSLPALKALRDAVKGANGDTTDMDAAIRKLGGEASRTKEKIDKFSDSTNKATSAQDRTKLAATLAGDALKREGDHLQALIDKQTEQASNASDVFSASQSFASSKQGVLDAQQALAEALKGDPETGKKDPKVIAQARRDLAAAMKQEADDAVALADANGKVAGKTLSANEKSVIFNDTLQKVRKQTGYWDEDLGRLSTQVHNAAAEVDNLNKKLIDNLKIREVAAYNAYHPGQPLNTPPPAKPPSIPSDPFAFPLPGYLGPPAITGPASARSLVHVEHLHLSSGHVRDFNDTIRAAERRQDDRRRALDTKRHVA